MKVPRLRMFAGPNGSGKSTIKTHRYEHRFDPIDPAGRLVA
jgi:predicted ABC-type ATPase